MTKMVDRAGLLAQAMERDTQLARGESIDPSKYYFRTAIRFETSAPQYAFLNRLIAVSSGDRRVGGPIYTIEEIL